MTLFYIGQYLPKSTYWQFIIYFDHIHYWNPLIPRDMYESLHEYLQNVCTIKSTIINVSISSKILILIKTIENF